MKVIKLSDGNFVQEINIAGHIIICPLSYQAKKFVKDSDLKPYTDFLDKSYSPFIYKVVDFKYSEEEIKK
ncbi:hypothetical protein HOBO_228 [Bacillus phage Hobo]|uniref:Uncharacterized protein n=2 Tax=Caeruleovirus BM15 TaxID=1985178 RepID=A0A0S2MUR7_9CAUD|nr:hypothetical protein FD732_gp113 [Bacillus phage BM15]ALO79636.1 hypothetical protein BM10_232 [Bacillus phage BM15]AXQ66983.1 hypothetical protein HOBO_228 [Bacillus phage Hobo]